jgi:hypothetical protein
LFALGVREAIALRDADLAAARTRIRQLGIVRISAGLILMAKPGLLAGALGWDDGDRGATTWLPRLVALRELCLGVGAMNSSRRDADPWPWLMTIATVDGVEGLVLMAALIRRDVDPAGGCGYAAADFGSATAVVLRAAQVASRSPGPKPY